MRITVGVPIFNAAATLVEAIRSIIAQSLQDWELILVDDGSGDNSIELARRVSDPRVRLVADGFHRGLACRLNQIAGMARTPYLARMDADDLMHPDRLRRQVEALEHSPSLDVIGTAAFTMDGKGILNGVRGQRAGDFSPKGAIARGVFIHPTVSGRTAWFRQNPYSERFVRAEDHELWCRTVSTSRFAVLADPLYFYREGGQNSLARYVESCRTDRTICRRHGPSAAGWGWTVRRLLVSHCKQTAYRMAFWTGLEANLISLRNRPLRPEQRADAADALSAIRSTPISGLEETLTGPRGVTCPYEIHLS